MKIDPDFCSSQFYSSRFLFFFVFLSLLVIRRCITIVTNIILEMNSEMWVYFQTLNVSTVDFGGTAAVLGKGSFLHRWCRCYAHVLYVATPSWFFWSLTVWIHCGARCRHNKLWSVPTHRTYCFSGDTDQRVSRTWMCCQECFDALQLWPIC